jgi:hypothetical protein
MGCKGQAAHPSQEQLVLKRVNMLVIGTYGAFVTIKHDAASILLTSSLWLENLHDESSTQVPSSLWLFL